MRGSKSEQRLEGRHRRFPPIVTKYEFIQVNLELIATHSVMGAQQPLLEIAKTADGTSFLQALREKTTIQDY
jgi:hypothetical protein